MGLLLARRKELFNVAGSPHVGKKPSGTPAGREDHSGCSLEEREVIQCVSK
jgi:hypothetical protein